MIIMATTEARGLSAALPLGSQLSCTTTRGDILRGNVIATDDTSRVVVIKEDSSTPSSNIHIVNLNHVSDMDVLSLPSDPSSQSPPPPLPKIDLQKVQRRLEDAVRARRKEIEYRGVNVTDEAQQLFDSLRKMYNDIHWDGSTIVILNDVHIPPPYTPESCSGSNPLTTNIQKQVIRFHEKQQKSV